jgi:hypothetical protein
MQLSFTARNGTVTQAMIAIAEDLYDISPMLGKRLHTIEDWQTVMPRSLVDAKSSISKWLNELFGNLSRKG